LRVGQGRLQERDAAPALQELAAAVHRALAYGLQVLGLHFQRQAGALHVVEQVSHRDVHHGGDDAAVQAALRIEQEILGFEDDQALAVGVADVQAQQAGQEKLSELGALGAQCVLEGAQGGAFVHR